MSYGTDVIIARVIDAAFTAFEAKLDRDDLVAKVTAAVRGGLPLDQVSDFILKMRDEALAQFKRGPGATPPA
jgi:hypothetical protein